MQWDGDAEGRGQGRRVRRPLRLSSSPVVMGSCHDSADDGKATIAADTRLHIVAGEVKSLQCRKEEDWLLLGAGNEAGPF